jgi:pyruvate ferredoxin oxidoreductase gamma subunit
MLGLLAGISGIITTEDAEDAVRGYMPEKIQERNINAILKAAGEAIR